MSTCAVYATANGLRAGTMTIIKVCIKHKFKINQEYYIKAPLVMIDAPMFYSFNWNKIEQQSNTILTDEFLNVAVVPRITPE